MRVWCWIEPFANLCSVEASTSIDVCRFWSASSVGTEIGMGKGNTTLAYNVVQNTFPVCKKDNLMDCTGDLHRG